MMNYPKKLIEVALPLAAINRESAREKSIRHGHPSTLHIWWARRPLAACRAVLFASLVDDPSSQPDKFATEEAQQKERQRLFRIIEELVKWENLNNERVLAAARAEIQKATGGHPPAVLDPFCGGGSIPLEAQRLGLEAHASDLNPVAVLITKALIEIPPKFAGRPPVNPEVRGKIGSEKGWTGAKGLAEDVRYYGKWMREEAEKRIGHLYLKVKLPKEYGGGEATVIAWLWARTVKCPNPACRAETPLLSSFVLSSKKGRQWYIHPVVDGKSISFMVRPDPPEHLGDPKNGYKRGMSGIFQCAFCKMVTTRDYVASEGLAGRLGQVQTSVVVKGGKGSIYLSPGFSPVEWEITGVERRGLDSELSANPRDVWCRNFGLLTPADLFTPRQLVALTTFSDLVNDARERVLADARKADISADSKGLNDGGTGTTAYADAVATYLAFAVDRSANYWSSLTPWGGSFIVQTFGRQALPMVWDFAEGNPLSESTGNWLGAIEWITKCLDKAIPAEGYGRARQLDATAIIDGVTRPLIFTDPPYYDNIGYADLSDFFYVWMRRSLGKIYPDLFSTLLTPKAQELVALPYRFGGEREKAQRFFEEGLGQAFARMREVQHPEYPLIVFYAFKQAESEEVDENGHANRAVVVASTGWETMLEGLLNARLAITGTWPLRTERDQGFKTGINVLASSIVLVCRLCPEDAALATRREFMAALRKELPDALEKLQRGNIAPVDLAQASIGPGMAVFSRYAKVLEADGSPMKVRTALQLINQALDEFLAKQEGEHDADTRWALAWFEQFGMAEAPFGEAETLSKAKNTSVKGMEEAGILRGRAGKVRLLKRDELLDTWDPAKDSRFTVWEATQYLIRTLEQAGEQAAADLLRRLGGVGEAARDLAYRLYTICDRKRWADEARAYNSLVVAWPRLVELAARVAPTQEQLGFERRR